MDVRGIGLHLLNGPYVSTAGRRRELPEGSKRLLVLVAVRGCVARRQAAELLWPEVPAARAAGNLRSVSWRLRCADLPLLVEQDAALRLQPEVCVDVAVLCRQAAAFAGGASGDDLALLPMAVEALDLLPGWYEDWVCLERERVRALMLHAIDAIAIGLRRAGRCAEAIDAALVAVTADPLRETSQGALIAAHLGEGNVCEARRAFAAYRAVLHEEFGIDPPERIARLVGLPVDQPARTVLTGRSRPAARAAAVPRRSAVVGASA